MANASAIARESILLRITRANARGRRVPSAKIPPQAIFPPIHDVRARFLHESAGNLMEVFETADLSESATALESVLRSLPAGEIYVQDHPDLACFLADLKRSRPVRLSSQGAIAENSQAALTLAHAFVAQSGSILSSSMCGGRGASIVPPCHIVYGRAEQIVPEIDDALALAQRQVPEASYIGLISGSSRTADIEKILVQGAHGPRRLVVILEGQDPDFAVSRNRVNTVESAETFD
ncbi:MAG TPA: LUD domain-containing protein [Candidatus Binatia bacterium]|nr:LUD domain-containing protein [Candidatus Binatia bacterium]